MQLFYFLFLYVKEMLNHSRTYNSIANSLYGIIASVITVILNFAVRVVLVRQLGEEINGINSLFQSIISMMALMEMGISSAMIIHLYEPVKNNNQETIAGIMNFYRQIYYYIAVAFTIVGILVSFFLLERLVTSSISIETVRVYFLFFTFAFVVNYLTYYKRSLLFAEQKNRISTLVTAICEIIFRTLQLLSLLCWQNYYLFLVLLAIEKFTGNMICQYYVNKCHPYLVHSKAIIPSEKKKAIFNTVKPLMVNQTASTMQNAASSILISLLLGNVSIVGYFGVYQLIISVVTLFFSQFGAAFTTSFGNLAVEKNSNHMKVVYRNSAFIFDWMACICTAAVLACADDFVYLFFGENFVLQTGNVLLLSLQMLIGLIAVPIISIQNAMGLHCYDSTAMVVQAVLAIIGGYILGGYWGMPGILVGLLIPTFCILLIRKGIIIGKVAMSMRGGDFLLVLVPDMIYIIIVGILTILVCKCIRLEVSLFSIFVKLFISLMFSVIVTFFIARLFRSNELKAAYSIVAQIRRTN